MKSKPVKFGVKVWALANSQSKYEGEQPFWKLFSSFLKFGLSAYVFCSYAAVELHVI